LLHKGFSSKIGETRVKYPLHPKEIAYSYTYVPNVVCGKLSRKTLTKRWATLQQQVMQRDSDC